MSINFLLILFLLYRQTTHHLAQLSHLALESEFRDSAIVLDGFFVGCEGGEGGRCGVVVAWSGVVVGWR